MYQPPPHEETDPAVLHALMRAHPLGAWVVPGVDGLIANHVPFLVDATRGPHGTLVAHVARANPVWKALAAPAASVVMFQGAQAYVTPSWYPTKHAHGKAVPTWNYAVVHAHGVPRVVDDAGWLLAHVTQLSNTHEAGQALPWQVADAPADYIERMLAAIVGIEIPIDRLEGKWKVSQNRPAADRLGVQAGLVARNDDVGREMAALVRDARPPLPG
jgi:transcriptional regulator